MGPVTALLLLQWNIIPLGTPEVNFHNYDNNVSVYSSMISEFIPKAKDA